METISTDCQETVAFLSPEQLERVEGTLKAYLVDIGVQKALVVDTAGNIVGQCGNGRFSGDVQSLAALASANFAAVSAMAKIIGEKQFSLFFQKGKRESIHFSRIDDDLLLVVVFDKAVSLGRLRMNLEEVISKIKILLKMA